MWDYICKNIYVVIFSLAFLGSCCFVCGLIVESIERRINP